jgi:hypothetical protein
MKTIALELADKWENICWGTRMAPAAELVADYRRKIMGREVKYE